MDGAAGGRRTDHSAASEVVAPGRIRQLFSPDEPFSAGNSFLGFARRRAFQLVTFAQIVVRRSHHGSRWHIRI
jgi:hypothetical protein